MSASVYLDDQEFDLLVASLQALMTSDRADSIGQWEIRLTLGGHNVLPVSVQACPEPVDQLVNALRSISAPRAAPSQTAELRVA